MQLLADASRGWAWTRALLGLRADVVHVAGDPSAVELVSALAARAGDSFEERRYARFAPLTVQAGGLEGGAAGWAGVAPGDCVVAFSRRDIFAIKAGVEAATPHRAAVVYGALPPETRRQQVGGQAVDLAVLRFISLRVNFYFYLLHYLYHYLYQSHIPTRHPTHHPPRPASSTTPTPRIK